MENGGPRYNIVYLNKTANLDKQVEEFKNSNHVVLAFPLYTDAMPGIVKYFIEALEPLCGRKTNPGLGFVVQSGFPETIHSRGLEKYLVKLARRLNCPYAGTVIKGGVEGLQVMPAWTTRKLFKNFNKLGTYYAERRTFDPVIIKKLAGRERLSPLKLWGFRFMKLLGMTDIYWNSQLKKNHAFDERYESPHAEIS